MYLVLRLLFLSSSNIQYTHTIGPGICILLITPMSSTSLWCSMWLVGGCIDQGGWLSPQVSSTPNNKTSDPSTPAAKARVSPCHWHPHTPVHSPFCMHSSQAPPAQHLEQQHSTLLFIPTCTCIFCLLILKQVSLYGIFVRDKYKKQQL